MRFKKTDHKLLKTLFRKKNEGEAMRLLIDEAKNFVEYYIAHKEGDFNTTSESQFYNLTALSKHLGASLTKPDFMDLLFYCPFDFTNLLEGLNILSSEQQILKKLQVKPKTNDQKNETVEEEENVEDEVLDPVKAKSLKEADDFHQVKSEETRQLLEMASNLNEMALDPNKKREFLKVMIDFGKKYENDDDEGTPGMGTISSGGVKRQPKNSSIDIDSNKRNLKSTATNLGISEKDLLSKNIESKGHKKSRMKNAITGGSDEDDDLDDEPSPGAKKNLRDSKKSGTIKESSAEVLRESMKKRQDSKPDVGKAMDSPDKLRESQKRLSSDMKSNETSKEKDSAIAKYGEKEFHLQTVKDDPTGFGYIYTDDESEDKEDLINNGKDDSDEVDEDDDDKDDKDDDDDEDDKDEEDEDDEDGSESEEGTGEKKKKKKGKGKGKGKKSKKPSNDKSIEKKAFSLLGMKKGSKAPQKEYKLLKEMKNSSNSNATIKDMTRDLKAKLNKSPNESKELKPIVAEKSAHDVFAKLVNNQSSSQRVGVAQRERKESSSASRGSPNFQLMTDDEDELNFDDLHVIHQEITREDGETEIITVATKKMPLGKIGQKRPKRDRKKPNQNQVNDDDSIEIMVDENGIPIAVRSKNKKQTSNASKVPHAGLKASELDGRKWDYEDLKKTLDKTNMNEIDKVLRQKKKLKKEMRKSLNVFERLIKKREGPGYKSSFGRRIQFRRSVDHTEHSRSPDGRRNSAPSALLTTLGEDEYQAIGKDDLLELVKSAYRHERRKKKSSQKSLGSKVPANTKDQQPFYTPFSTNSKTKNVVRYISYLNSLLFLKKIDDVVVDFLIGQFIKSHQAATGLNFNSGDKNFREQFKKSYAKAIRTLKDKLKRNKEFIQNTFFQMFFYNIDNIDFDINLKKALEPIILKAIPISDENLFSPPVKPDVIVPVSPSQIADKGLARTQPDFTKTKVKLPPIKSKKPAPPVSKFNPNSYRSMKSIPKTNEFNDSRMRTLEDNTYEEDDEGEPVVKTVHTNQFTAEIDIGKLMKIIPDHIKENYMFYWNNYGDPMSLDLSFFLSKISVPERVQPYLIVLMANRLGIKIAEYSDLTWIPYMHLISKLPSNFDLNSNSIPKDKLLLKIAYLPTGDHPGDNYFYSLLNYHKAKRQIILDNIAPDQRNQFIKAQSWIKMKNDHGLTYYFNFYSKQKSNDMPTELKESFTKVSLVYSKPFVKENLKSLGYLILRNDDLLAYFKHKH